MEIEKRKRGRPRKKGDTIEFWRFVRSAIALCAYDEARGSGEKHRDAVRRAVHFVKQLNRDMSISETEVKRTLAAWRRRGSRTILRFERSVLSDKDVNMNRWIREYLATLHGKKGVILPVPPKFDRKGTVAIFTIRLAEKPNYPRHNLKNRQE